jgi:hypothetical protein
MAQPASDIGLYVYNSSRMARQLFFKFILDVESSEMNTKSYLPVSSIANANMTDALNDKVGQ